jgi:hypothetical protein
MTLTLAERIVKVVLDELDGRRGVGDELSELDDAVRQEMIATLVWSTSKSGWPIYDHLSRLAGRSGRAGDNPG